MMRFLQVLLLFSVLVLALPQYANARCGGYPEEFGSEKEAASFHNITKDAVFVGLLRIDNIKVISRKESSGSESYQKRFFVVTATPVQAYIGDLKHSIIFEVEEGFERVGPGKKGQIVERIIYQNDDGSYQTTGQCVYLMKERWAFLREHTVESDVYNNIREKCEEGGGNLRIDTNHPLHCLYPSSDKGDDCIDSMQCEGVCIANTDHVTGIDEARLSITFDWADAKKFKITEGQCSEWKNQKGCHVEYKDGYRVRQQCVKY